MIPSYGDNDLKAWRVFGLKPLLASALLLPIVNPVARVVGRHVLPAHLVQRLPLRADYVELRLLNGEHVKLLNPERDLIARDVYWGQGRPTSRADDRILRCVERLCAEGGTFLDIGAYTGAFAMLAAKANPRTVSVAYEIVPENFLQMTKNVIANNLNSLIDLRLIGLGSHDDTVTIPANLNLVSNASSISLSSVFKEGNTVPVTTMDGESRNWRGPLSMKIDVEGFELEVLTGGKGTIQRLKPTIVCEILGSQNPEKVGEIESMMKSFGYTFFQSEDEGLIERTSISPTMKAKDWVFSCRPDIKKFLE